MTVRREAIYLRDGGLCGFCHTPVDWNDFDIDHVTPRALGGETSEANVRVAHAACNRSAAWDVRKQVGGPRLTPAVEPDVVHVLFVPELGKQVRDLAKRERRAISTQVQILVERALAMESPAGA